MHAIEQFAAGMKSRNAEVAGQLLNEELNATIELKLGMLRDEKKWRARAMIWCGSHRSPGIE